MHHTLDNNLRTLTATITETIESVTSKMLQNTWRENKYRLDVFRATKGAHIKTSRDMLISTTPKNDC